MKKRLIVCCDGTWNAPEINNPRKNRATNVLKLCRAIIPEPSPQECQVVEYIPGIGTHDVIDRFLGGSSGWGISRNIQPAYQFLVNNYLPGNDIFLFGFSRGAYTVRSLSGFIEKAGLIKKTSLHLFPQAFRAYRDGKISLQARALDQQAPMANRGAGLVPRCALGRGGRADKCRPLRRSPGLDDDAGAGGRARFRSSVPEGLRPARSNIQIDISLRGMYWPFRAYVRPIGKDYLDKDVKSESLAEYIHSSATARLGKPTHWRRFWDWRKKAYLEVADERARRLPWLPEDEARVAQVREKEQEAERQRQMQEESEALRAAFIERTQRNLDELKMKTLTLKKPIEDDPGCPP